MSRRFSFGNMDAIKEDDTTQVRRVYDSKTGKTIIRYNKEPIIRPLRRKWFWERWYQYLFSSRETNLPPQTSTVKKGSIQYEV